MSSRVIGVVIPTTDNSFFSSFAYQAEKYLHASGYQVLICSSANDAEREKEYLKLLSGLGAEGIICISGLQSLPEDLLPESYPLVWVDRVPESARIIPWVANDDEKAMESAVDYLIGKGCRNILLAPGYLAENQDSPRVAGYRKALSTAGMEYHEEYVLKRKGAGTSEAETELLVKKCLEEGFDVDGIITSSDRAAFGAMAALRSVGLYVPEDAKLITFDNSPYSSAAGTPITALDRNPGQLTEKACEILLKELSGVKNISIENEIPVSIVERDSTR